MSYEYKFDDPEDDNEDNREDSNEDVNEDAHECDKENECKCNSEVNDIENFEDILNNNIKNGSKNEIDDDFKKNIGDIIENNARIHHIKQSKEIPSDDFNRKLVDNDEKEQKDDFSDISEEIIENNRKNYFEKYNPGSQNIKSKITKSKILKPQNKKPSNIISAPNKSEKDSNVKSTFSNESKSSNLRNPNKTLDSYFKRSDNSKDEEITINPKPKSKVNEAKTMEILKNSDILKDMPDLDMENIDPKLRELFPDIFENPRSDPWKFWISMTHASPIISDVIEQYRAKYIRAINNLEPYYFFINSLKKDYNLKNDKLLRKPGKISTEDPNDFADLKNYINISEYIMKNIDSKQKTKELVQSHQYKYSFKDIGDLLKISRNAARNSLKQLFTDEELKNLLKSKKSVLVDLRKIVKRKDGKIIDVAQDAKAKDRVTLECKYNHKWETSIDSVLHMNTWCPTCNTFVGEKVCRKVADKLFDGHFRKYKPGSLPWLVNSRGNGMELDGYDPKLRIALEYQGRFHYENDRTSMSDDELKQRMEDDTMKKKLCSQKNILLIQVPYTVDMDNFDKFMHDEYNKNASRFDLPKINSFEDIDISKFDIYQNKDYEKFENYISEKGGKLITPYIAAKERITLECEHGHQWTTTPDSIYRNNWCSVCAGNKKLDQEEFKEMLSQHGFTLESNLINARTKVKIKCENDHITRIKPFYLKEKIDKNKKICLSCEVKKFGEELSQHEIILLEEMPNLKYSARLKCKNNHVFKLMPYDIKQKIKNNQKICPYCEE